MNDNEYLHFTQDIVGDTLVVSLVGEVCYGAQAVLGHASAEIGRHRGPVRVDLALVPFLDSTGVNFLVRQQQLVAGRGQSFTVTGTQPHPARVLEICGLTELLATGETPGPDDATDAPREPGRAPA